MGAKISSSKNLIVLFLLLTFAAACGGGSSFGDSNRGSDDEVAGESLEGGAVTVINFDSATDSATINFGSLAGSERFVLAIYNYNETGTTEAYQIGSLNADLVALLTSPQALTTDITEDFHGQLREIEADLDESAYLGGNEYAGVQFAVVDPDVGSTRDLKILTSFSGGSFGIFNATLRYKSSNILFYMDSRDNDALSDTEIKNLMDPFDDLNDEERAIFGNESDIDNNGRYIIFMTREVNKLGGAAGGIITGFFYAVDLFSEGTYSQSNEAEIAYIARPDSAGQHGVAISKSFALSNILPSVAPHELQHMINFNMHFFKNDGPSEDSSINEGLAHLAEDLYSIDASGYMTSTGIENPARVAGYLKQMDTLCITCGSSLYQRGGIYLLLRYLYEQAQKGNLPGASSGQDFINKLIDTDKTGVDNIVNAAYGDVDVESNFRQLFGQFVLAVFMSDTGLTTDSRLGIDGFPVRGDHNDNRGTVTAGPQVDDLNSFPFSSTIGGTSVSFVEISASDINSAGGSIQVQVSDGTHSGGYLIQTGL